MTNTVRAQFVPAAVLAVLVDAARSFADDLESGLADGTYDDGAQLEPLRAALASLEAPPTLGGTPDDYLARYPEHLRETADGAYQDGFADGADSRTPPEGFRVAWVIDVDAETSREAAERACDRINRGIDRGDSWAPAVFQVTNVDGDTVEIDLAAQDEERD